MEDYCEQISDKMNQISLTPDLDNTERIIGIDLIDLVKIVLNGIR